MRKTEGLVKYPVVFLKPLRMQYDLMVVIFTIPLQTWPWQKCVPVPLNIMVYRTENVCYVDVISAQLFSYPFSSKIKIQQTCVQQYVTCLTKCFTLYCSQETYIPQTNNMFIVFHSDDL